MGCPPLLKRKKRRRRKSQLRHFQQPLLPRFAGPCDSSRASFVLSPWLQDNSLVLIHLRDLAPISDGSFSGALLARDSPLPREAIVADSVKGVSNLSAFPSLQVTRCRTLRLHFEHTSNETHNKNRCHRLLRPPLKKLRRRPLSQHLQPPQQRRPEPFDLFGRTVRRASQQSTKDIRLLFDGRGSGDVGIIVCGITSAGLR